jgi:2-keto-3-deoxy-L-fuconate dehydrogenase
MSEYFAPDRLTGKQAFVTGAAQGIGRACAIRLAREGAAVVAADLKNIDLSDLGELQIQTLKFDATDAVALERAFSQLTRIDVLVNCVGWVHHGTIVDCTPDDWSRSFRTNVDSYFHATRLALPFMLRQRAGSIVNIASPASSIKAIPFRAAYSASKAAVLGLTKSVAIDFVKQGIRCNAICPGTTASPSLEDRIHAFPDPVAARAAFIARQPMGRLGTPEEMAALCAYLASDESRFMTGAFVVIDGAGSA